MADELFVNVYGSVRRTELKEVDLNSLSVHDLKERVYQALNINRSEHGKQFPPYTLLITLPATAGSSVYVCASTYRTRADPGVFPRFPETGQITSG